MPDVSFVGPQSLLNHVWINLIGNAVKFVKGDGSGRIIVRLTPNEKNVVVTVADNGIGMDDKTIAHIFENFIRAILLVVPAETVLDWHCAKRSWKVYMVPSQPRAHRGKGPCSRWSCHA